MRTTVTLDPDVAALVAKAMEESGASFKAAINNAIRSGLGASSPIDIRTPTFHMGFDPDVPIDKSLRLAAELEDEELIRKLALHK